MHRILKSGPTEMKRFASEILTKIEIKKKISHSEKLRK